MADRPDKLRPRTGGEAAPDAACAPRHDCTTAGGTCCRIVGDPKAKPAVVLLHGVGLNKEMWEAWLPALVGDFAVVAYDLLGHGGSANPPGERSAEVFCDQLRQLVDELGIGRFSVVGFSLGAVLAQAFAALHPERLRHAVFLHSIYRRSAAQRAAVRERYAMTRDQGPLATVELALQRWYSPEFIAANPRRMAQLRSIFAGHTDDGYLKAYRFFCTAEQALRAFDMTTVAVPSLVLTGGADTGSTPAMSAALAADLPQARLLVNPGHQHMAPDEHAGRLAEQVRSFLAEG